MAAALYICLVGWQDEVQSAKGQPLVPAASRSFRALHQAEIEALDFYRLPSSASGQIQPAAAPSPAARPAPTTTAAAAAHQSSYRIVAGWPKDEAQKSEHSKPSKAKAAPAPQADVNQLTRPSVCWACGARIHGPLPTTYRPDALANSCTWQAHQGLKALSDAATIRSERLSLESAQLSCTELGEQCQAVWCDGSRKCTLHKTKDSGPGGKQDTVYMKRALGSQCPITKEYTVARGVASQATPLALEPDTRIDAHMGMVPANIGIVLLAHNRQDEIGRCLSSLFLQPGLELFQLFVSIDDPETYEDTSRFVQNLAAEHGVTLTVWPLVEARQPSAKDNEALAKWFKMNTGKIAHHYWVAFERAFQEYGLESAIFVEEDLIFAPDFLALFRSTHWLFDADPSLWCVSGWNDYSFDHSSGDSCRLLRTSFFSGLGFMLRKQAWDHVRSSWPYAPTMGWDYAMRVQLRDAGKECIIPEVSRSHHFSNTGSSIRSAKQVRLMDAMTLAKTPTACGSSGPCHQFGNISYLVSESYDGWMREAIRESKRVDKPSVVHENIEAEAGTVYALGFVHEERISVLDHSIYPGKLNGAIPNDLRSEHYGLVAMRYRQRSWLLLMDLRSPRMWSVESRKPHPKLITVGANRGQNCRNACSDVGMICDNGQMYFVNNCTNLRKHFACEAGCAHQIGPDLPAYVPEDSMDTYQQCLVTYTTGSMNCASYHKNTARLCACIPG
eukprot:CAMPEP_0206566504 /NCGR_PEP_ID=MMETSP0325_2-20121206/24700_1 /ASSEMBLY_ACC=CAM_ASM_000347 /TAXON_ID=2866 /ORGANISM="Crypthecodinium cohnii, Strain Seligo" /LENGTH=727 /DNA_ID=CAMNT_0054069551 /DNA_START=230 /DNA_END=2414 /DNA_ORIENTATION=+